MKLALCGLASSGKSTLFQALSGRKITQAKARDEASQALLPVPDARVDELSAMYSPKKTTYAQITFVDPPQPLAKADDPTTKLPADLRGADALVEVVRNFDGGLGAPDPASDLEEFAQEMLLNDLITVERRLERMEADKKRGRKQDEEELALLTEAKALLDAETPLRTNPDLAGHVKLKGFGLLTAKPLLIVANNDEDDAEAPDLGCEVVVIRAAIEAEILELEAEEAAEFMSDLGLTDSALDRLIQAGYKAMDLISFFTVGEDEVRAWTVKRGALAPQAAGVIHSDLERGFIRAEIMGYADLLEHGSEAALKKAGLMKLAGKDHVVSDGEILHVRFSV